MIKDTHVTTQSEQQAVKRMIEICSDVPFDRIDTTHRKVIADMEKKRNQVPVISKFMAEYQLNSQEGLALMTLAEALLRIPDTQTMEKLIEDKLVQGDWSQRSKQNNELLVLLGSTGLKFSKHLLSTNTSITSTLFNLFKPLSKTAIRHTVKSTINTFANQFILADNIDNAIKKSKDDSNKGIWFSFDMLGESAISDDDADRYYTAYENAIKSLSAHNQKDAPIQSQPGISVKLSAISPQIKTKYWHETINIVSEKLLKLAIMAHKANIQLTIDAEESWRLEISHAIIERVFSAPELDDYNGFGIVIQAYLISAVDQCRWAIDLAMKNKKRLMVRLVKGAYWDAEIKHTQVNGHQHYSVFTHKYHTDLSYLSCAKILIDRGSQTIYPQFGTHNTYTLAAVVELVQDRRDFEIQSLYGMCDQTHRHLLLERGGSIRTRIYAPIGSKKDLLAYLVRRILENGANHSVFNAWISGTNTSETTLNPMERSKQSSGKSHDMIPSPKHLYPDRINSLGPDLDCHKTLTAIQNHAATFDLPAIENTNQDTFDKIVTQAHAFKLTWRNTATEDRAKSLENAAIMIQENFQQWISALILEGKKTADDAVSEVRETIDFLNYYAFQARCSLKSETLHGPTGESNTLHYTGKGLVVCLSPWNFPMAIFTGQIVAALVSGNCVIAKPARQTPRIATMIVETLHKSGIPKEALGLIIGSWGPQLVDLPDIAAVMLTGSTETAKVIQQKLAQKPGPIVPVMAETGGLNVMIADSTALREQLATDVIQSAFRSAGQRCSALRVLYVPENGAEEYIDAIIGAMKLLNVTDSTTMAADVGPLIDEESMADVQKHLKWLDQNATCLHRCTAPDNDSFIGPSIYKIESLDMLKSEIFGPILHVITYKPSNLDKVISAINHSKYGLTLGVHSRIDSQIDHIIAHTQVGNNYVNRDIIGATVGVQPFGGNGLSGTGPKAGGPNMLRRLCYEKTITVNTTASGGNAALINMTAEP